MSDSKKIQIRGGFSDRMKIQPLSTEIQLKDFDSRTRIAIANLVLDWLGMNEIQAYIELIYESILKEAFNEIVLDSTLNYFKCNQDKFKSEYIVKPIQERSYHEVLTLVEHCAKLLKGVYGYIQRQNQYFGNFPREEFDFEKSLNALFQKEFVGYRMIDGLITPISDEIEVNEIKDALVSKYDSYKSHISKALAFLSNRENPDYKNSIKESISAIESICQIIADNSKATLGNALDKLKDKGLNLHPAMLKAFKELYGYTSDQGGIRHAGGMFEGEVSFEEAKYMLVSCCAFGNFLILEDSKE